MSPLGYALERRTGKENPSPPQPLSLHYACGQKKVGFDQFILRKVGNFRFSRLSPQNLQNQRDRAWWEDVDNGDAPFAVPDEILAEFIRIATTPRFVSPPQPMAKAVAFAAKRSGILINFPIMKSHAARLGILALLFTACELATDPEPNGEFEIWAAGKRAPFSSRHPVFRKAFVDGFEFDRGWGIFEEIVGGNPCYGDGIGSVDRTANVSRRGRHSLRVWANTALSLKSNHVIANKKVFESGMGGRWIYAVWAYLDSSGAFEGQAGPEFSLQNTRELSPGVFRTATAGVQYRSNIHDRPGRWAFWLEVSPGVAGWVDLHTQPLAIGRWYFLLLEADYDANRYVRFRARGPGVNVNLDLRSHGIALEDKFAEEAFWITLESENLWNNCGTAGIFDSRVHYDDAILLQKRARPGTARRRFPAG